MKKIIGIILSILLAISLAGCIKGEIHITVNRDKSADVEINFGVDKSLYSLIGSKDPLSDIKTSLEKEGFNVSDFSDDKYKGIIGKNHYTDLDKGINNLKLSDKAVLSGNNSLKVDKGFFFNKYTIDTNIDMSSVASDKNITEDEKKFQDMFINNISMDFIITMPVKAISNNASVISQDEKTYTWNLMPGINNKISMKVMVPNISRIILTALSAIIFIILLIIIIKNKRKKDIVI